MNKGEWQQIGEDIRRQVQHAIDTNNFTELSKTIGETVGQAVEDVGKSINGIGKSLNDAVSDVTDSFQQGIHQPSGNKNRQQMTQEKTQAGSKRQKWERYNGTVYYAKPNLRPDPKLFSGTPAGSISGIIWLLVGLGMTGIAGFATVYHAMEILIGMESLTALALPVTATTTGMVVGAYGAGLKQRESRFRQYVEMVKDKLYCSIEEMAGKTGRSKRFVRRDLKRMMQKGMFLQAHLDKKESCFIASDAMYEQYMLTQKQYEEKLRIESKESEEKQIQETVSEPADESVAKVLKEGREYIAIIRKCNDEIPAEGMSEKLDRLELLVTRIFMQVEEKPELAPELQKMLSYYLPTTQKLLEAYRDLDKQNVEVKNISDTKREIELTVDTINGAFEMFLDELFRDRAWDIQSDITVLNTMLKQDGYVKPDFENGEKE